MYIENEELWLFDSCEALRDVDAQYLSRAIELISREIDEYCNTRFEPTEDFYALDYCRSFFTRRQPLLSVSELLLNGTPLSPDSDYFVYPEQSRVKLADSVITGAVDKALTLRYNYGFASVPATVKSVIADIIKLDVQLKADPGYGMKSESWDGEYSYTRSFSKDFTPGELRRGILARLDGFIIPRYAPPSAESSVRVRFL